MGGASAGEVASRVAVETFAAGLPAGDELTDRLASVVGNANQKIHDEAASNPSRQGMGTTLTAAMFDADRLVLAHVGDSRAYRYRSGTLEQLTRDHTLVDELVRQGRLTEEEAAVHPQRSIITRALGPEASVEVDTAVHELQADDVVLLCSDGLTGMISEQVITSVLDQSKSLAAATRALVKAANEAGGRDNITVVLARVGTSVAPLSQVRPGALRPKAGGAAQAKKRRGSPKVVAGIAAAILLLVLLAAGWQASRGAFFIGVDRAGVVTVYQGVPYELPGGIAESHGPGSGAMLRAG
jgi:protein phosphatase